MPFKVCMIHICQTWIFRVREGGFAKGFVGTWKLPYILGPKECRVGLRALEELIVLSTIGHWLRVPNIITHDSCSEL